MAEFDFDHWRRLAERNPEAFFRARSSAIERFIDAHEAEDARRLREMQGYIDCARLAAGTPLNALRTISRMMEEHLTALHEQGAALREATAQLDAAMAHLDRLERIL
ncbi:DUF3135 domain-containing protein [Pseudothauera rhizosphaerae]|uniref:DUF3135 domain-containing protein n=1 Tax=Pseudothauera rhizosphaerae TaxID=2565932 RepID=A0A4V3WB16_9RHOO|nr:DUF3135 domain-containing protein [Pseudothauera rhizosphaerae]THF60977.1 DUF3135 domain-containing protein [Pseudothauera rhizosphaerae]